MRAVMTLRREFDPFITFVHAARRNALWRSVAGLVAGGRLWLTGLGRDLPGETSDKHRIKAADRLLGNAALHCELRDLYRARAKWLLAGMPRPVLVVDWTGIGSPFHVLSAAVCCEGRALPIYSEVHRTPKLENHDVHRRFLRKLFAILPKGCKPVVVTDAGFYARWFQDVAAQGWDFIGRVRGRTHIEFRGKWVALKKLYQRATKRPKNLGMVLMRRNRPCKLRLVLSAAPKGKQRKRLTRKGTVGLSTQDRQKRAQAVEPWLLATSLRSNSKAVVALYSLRMQIEETFRDAKNYRHGWALRHVHCRSAKRIEVLLFIAALTFVLVEAVGCAAEKLKLHYHFQANTIRKRRVLSWFVLGRLVLRRAFDKLVLDDIQQALKRLLSIALGHGLLAAPM